MAKNKQSKSRDAYPKLPASSAQKNDAPPPSHAIRETIESIVIAFVLAFLFRTFEAEAFVIPTGSMAPTLMGAHKDVDCIKCGHRFRVNSSEENGDAAPRAMVDSCLAGICPNCRYINPFRPGLAIDKNAGPVKTQKVYNGDRILVNKYIYTVSDPQRWDVVVFKYPGNAQMNYIKRLVGLPGETIRVFQGDLFTATGDNPTDTDFKIARKPPAEQMAMRQLVHDTDYDPAELYNAGWPLRWEPQGDASAWKVEAEAEDLTVTQRYAVDAPAGETAWLRYRNIVPSYNDWRQVESYTIDAAKGPLARIKPGALARPQLVTDFNAYNTRFTPAMLSGQQNPIADVQLYGLHWVGDLMVEADVNVQEAKGELILDLVEGGKHFAATFDLATGEVKLSAEGDENFAPTAKTAVSRAGSYQLCFSNFDDQLKLWVNGSLVDFDGSTEYDVDTVFGGRAEIIPRTSESDPGDLAPVGIGARDTKLEISRLQVCAIFTMWPIAGNAWSNAYAGRCGHRFSASATVRFAIARASI